MKKIFLAILMLSMIGFNGTAGAHGNGANAHRCYGATDLAIHLEEHYKNWGPFSNQFCLELANKVASSVFQMCNYRADYDWNWAYNNWGLPVYRECVQ